jgi:flagellin-like hook-associated protein FlgL
VGEIDYAEAIVEFTAAQSAYQAALQVASKGFSMSLMDFIQ